MDVCAEVPGAARRCPSDTLQVCVLEFVVCIHKHAFNTNISFDHTELTIHH